LKRLELDGYCANLQLAFEHNGRQHYEIGNLFSSTEADLSARKVLDEKKARLCFQQGVRLIVVPELLLMTELEDLPQLVKEQCSRQGVDIRGLKFGLRGLSRHVVDQEIDELRRIAHDKGGRLISTVYQNTRTKLEWECAVGHRWLTMPMHVKRGSWCSRCFYESRRVR
jgi:hypothetical protein